MKTMQESEAHRQRVKRRFLRKCRRSVPWIVVGIMTIAGAFSVALECRNHVELQRIQQQWKLYRSHLNRMEAMTTMERDQ